jgi:glucosamine--fructose-6-phosphate aminotransferase (isomerizing)
MYLAFAIARKPPRPLTQAVMRAIEVQEKILDRYEVILPPTLEFLNDPYYVALMSRGADLASAYEGALILKEVARLAAEPISAAQFRHGPIEILHPNHRYIIFARQCQPSGNTGKLLLKTATNVRLIEVEPLRLGLGTLVDIVYIHLLAHDLALRAGREPGKFRIAEGVTREE